MIRLRQISKAFGAVRALEEVSAEFEGGKVHALLGENGAGKSTLMNVLFGLVQPDAGTIEVDGAAVRISSPKQAGRLGIGMVHQHFKLVPTLSAAANVALATRLSVTRARGEIGKWVERLRWQLPMEVAGEELSVGQQQRVEIIKALILSSSGSGHGTLILDEPTAVLTPQETNELFGAIEALKGAGAAVVFITHKLAEVRRVADVVTILRRGKVVYGGAAGNLSNEEIAEKMVGGRVELPRLERTHSLDTPATVLSVENLSAGMLRNVFFHVNGGEILGIAGVDGNGQSDLMRVLVGDLKASKGSVAINNRDVVRATMRARLEEIALIPEDRHTQAGALAMSVRDNMMLKDYLRRPFRAAAGWLRFGKWNEHAVVLAKAFDVRAASIHEPLGKLSGGNQQKAILARELYESKKPVVIAANPTRGLDIGATAFVMKQLLAARARGAAVVLIHSDLDELLALSDRVAVLYSGTLTETLWPNTTKETIGQLMLGLTPAGAAARRGEG